MMTNTEINLKKQTLASLLTQKAISTDPTVTQLLNERIKEIETQIAVASQHDSTPLILQRAIEARVAKVDALTIFDDTEVRTAVGVVTSAVSSLLYRLLALDAWHASLASRQGQTVTGNSGWGFSEQTNYTNPEVQLQDCVEQTEAALTEVARWVKTYPLLVERAENEGIELQMGQNPSAGARDALPTCEQVYRRYAASKEAKAMQREADRRVIRAATPSVFAMTNN
jgi:hypothetical protein